MRAMMSHLTHPRAKIKVSGPLFHEAKRITMSGKGRGYRMSRKRISVLSTICLDSPEMVPYKVPMKSAIAVEQRLTVREVFPP